MKSLYIHIPFCKSKCAYCSFYSLVDDYKEEYINSLIRYVKHFGGKKLKTVYIGGGTPSALPYPLLARLLKSIRENFDMEKDAEFTIEANPESVSAEFLAVIAEYGVNRLSLGVQSLNDDELSAVGRIHSAKDVYRAIESARGIGLHNISCDLIFGLPLQTVESFSKNVTLIKGLDIPHISCYNLQLEKGTPIYNATVPDEDIQAQMYKRLCEILADYRHYEISNFCKDGFHSRHNCVYWTGEDYLGLGPAAHSKLCDTRYSFDADIKKFINRTDFSFDSAERITDGAFERLMLGLRTDSGVPIDFFKNSDAFIKQITDGGFARIFDGRLILTDKGYYLSNTIISELAIKENI